MIKRAYVNYYELLGERVVVDSFAGMVRSVAEKLYDMDSSVVTRMAKNNEAFPNWLNPVFSYDKNVVKSDMEFKKVREFISVQGVQHLTVFALSGLYYDCMISILMRSLYIVPIRIKIQPKNN